MEWQPIETAPRDGTEIWAFCDGEQVRMKFIEYPDEALWVYADQLLDEVDPNPPTPTHWMPLPPPPQEQTS